MRFNAQMNFGWSIGLAGLLACGSARGEEWVAIPRHAAAAGEAGGFDLGRRETSVGEFVVFLNAAAVGDFPETAQIARRGPGRYAVRRGMRTQAVAEVAAAEAEAYCRWRSREAGRSIRLPTGAEWEAAARGGVDGAPYPWGWGGDPRRLAQFDAAGPARSGGSFLANGFGLFDMAGNLFEWCAPDSRAAPGQREARGGSWAEHDPALLRVDRRQLFAADYRGRDVGFRTLREPLTEP